MRSAFLRTRELTLVALSAVCLAPACVRAQQHEVQRLAADPRGTVEIKNVAGSIDLQGWDKPQVEAAGTSGSDIERIAVTGEPAHIVVEAVTRQNRLWGSEGSAKLIVHVPSKSSVTVTTVSADVKVGTFMGDLTLQSVSGETRGEVGGDLHAGSVSGDIRMSAKSAKSISVKTVSGDVTLEGGSGESEVTTVSGTIDIREGVQTKAQFKSVSGDMTVSLGAAPGAQIEGQSVSGDLGFKFAAVPTGDVDVQTMSGQIRSCFGPKPTELTHGSGSRFEFKNGESGGRIHVVSKSGDVHLCTQGGS